MILLAAGIFIATGIQNVFAQATTSPFTDVSVGRWQACAVRLDGSLRCDTDYHATRLLPPDDIPALRDVSVGEAHACGIDTDGALICWGENFFEQLDAPISVRAFTSIAAGRHHSCAIDDAGEVQCWGLNTNGQASPPDDLGGVQQITGGRSHSCALINTGEVRCWGADDEGKSTVPPFIGAVTQIEAASSNTCILDTSGAIDCWGSTFAPIPDAGPYTDLAIGDRMICALTFEGVPDCRFADSTAPMVPSMAGFVGIEAGPEDQGCALDAAGKLACWNIAPWAFADDANLAAPNLMRIDVYSSSTVELFFGEVRDFVEITRNGELLAVTDASSSYVDSTLNPSTNYTYSLVTLTLDGRRSAPSNAITINTDITTPSPNDALPLDGMAPRPEYLQPLGLIATVYSRSALELFWQRQENPELSGYEVWRNGAYLGFTLGTSFMDRNVDTGSAALYTYTVIALNRQGESTGSSGLQVLGAGLVGDDPFVFEPLHTQLTDTCDAQIDAPLPWSRLDIYTAFDTNGQRLLVESLNLEGTSSAVIDGTLLDTLQKGATLQFSLLNDTAAARVSVITLDTTFFAERAMCLEPVDAVHYRENDSTGAFLRNGVFRAEGSGQWVESKIDPLNGQEQELFTFEEFGRGDGWIWLFENTRDLVIAISVYRSEIYWGSSPSTGTSPASKRAPQLLYTISSWN